MNTNGERLSKSPNFESLMYQLLETELGGVKIYEQALACVLNVDLKEEWHKYLGETKRHVQIARSLLEGLTLDPDADDVAARVPVRMLGERLVEAMQVARSSSGYWQKRPTRRRRSCSRLRTPRSRSKKTTIFITRPVGLENFGLRLSACPQSCRLQKKPRA